MARNVLPDNVRPEHYSISLFDLVLEECQAAAGRHTYSGQVDIDLTVDKPTDSVTLNAHKITVLAATVSGHAASITHDAATQRCNLRLDTPLPVGPARLSISFQATIADDLTGFYDAGQDVFCTQFQPSDARRAFPCFDEPALKATFDVSIETPQAAWTVLGNMPVKCVTTSARDHGRRVTTFETTPRMSTYLVAWAIGKFDRADISVPRLHAAPVSVSVYTVPGRIKHARLALDVASHVLQLFSKAFGVDYPLPKADLLAVPEMSDDAMENWGLVIFRESAILQEQHPALAPEVTNRVTYIIAHELAHQWFGNLVTMSWWDELWLNEGFATWAGWHACDVLHPEWKVWSQFAVESMELAFELDALPSTHPVQVPVADGLEVDSIFDYISYLKGASIVRMVAAHLRQDVFFQGVRTYLKAHAYGNSTASDLWRELTSASGQDVASLVKPWIAEPGFPLVSVTMRDAQIEVEQTPFAAGAEANTWWIPLMVQTEAQPLRASLDAPSSRVDLDGPAVKINLGHGGFYRTLVSSDALLALGKRLSVLAAEDRAGILNDAMATCFANKGTSTATLLSLMSCYRHETDYIVWVSVLECSFKLVRVFPETRAFFASLLAPAAASVDWCPKMTDSYSTQRLRPEILRAAGLLGNAECVESAVGLFQKSQATEAEEVPTPLEGAVYDVAVSQIGAQAAEEVLQSYKATSSSHMREILARALGHLTSPSDARKTVCAAFTEGVAAQDLLSLAAATAANPATSRVMFEFISDEWDLVWSRLGGSLALFDPFVRESLQAMSTEADVQQVRHFFAGKDTSGYARGVATALDKIAANAAFKEREEATVLEWLRENGHLA